MQVPSPPQPRSRLSSLDRKVAIEDVSSVSHGDPYRPDDQLYQRMLRRTKSVTRAEDIRTRADKLRKSQPDKP